MTTTLNSFRNNWVIFGHNTDGTAEQMYDLLRSEGITPTEYAIYNTVRGVLLAMGISIDTSQVFHGGFHVGDLAALKTQLYTLKRIHGEI